MPPSSGHWYVYVVLSKIKKIIIGFAYFKFKINVMKLQKADKKHYETAHSLQDKTSLFLFGVQNNGIQ